MSTPRLRIAGIAGPLLLCGLLAATAGCSFSPTAARSTPAGKVTVVLPASALPGQGYAFVPMPAVTAPEQDARVQDAQFRARLQQSLDSALQAKGYRPVELARADFLVAWRVGVRDVREVTAVQEDVGGTTPMAAIQCTGGRCSQLVVRSDDGTPVVRYNTRERTEGGLLVEMIEPGSIQVVWRALNTGTVSPGDAGQARLDAIAGNTLSQLPAHRP
ncbi:DUF4136 domain-containing protein [Pseudoxanthomonas suwonensis]|uniref:DUF4136 domain-containing protein n=1 Tax=Pseudoxanthomonas suwonensis TaxID=314722 RepID=A0A0E3UNE8_9GAMM|nr:DUF4136 domain-containing protein [Pseudoxanthomonas suwonensis]AKC87106.1 hypothetical protein WQ53_10470 [Pseudoxanthomonas suwonensis]